MSIESKNLAGAMLVATSFFMFWAFAIPEYQKISKFNTAISERRTALSDKQAILDKLKGYDVEYKKRAAEIKKFGSIVPAKKEIPELISALEALAKESGIVMRDLNLGEGKKALPGELATIGLIMQMEGTYSAFTTFFTNIERSSRLISVQKIALSPLQEGSPILSVSIDAETFFIK